MSIFEKKSIREEFDKIKESFQKQVKAGKVSDEVAALFNTLIMLFGVVLAVFMEKKTKKTTKNSSIPPSQTDEDNTSSSNRNNSKTRQTVTMADNTRTVETTQTLRVETCSVCGEDLSDANCACLERRTKIDIIFEATVEHYDAEIKTCPACKATVKADFPDDIAGPIQYGHGIKAYVLNLIVAQMVSLKRTAKLLSSMLGRLLSDATLLSYIGFVA